MDLGCAPGSWSRYAFEQIGHSGSLVGIDIQEVAGFPGQFLQQSIEEVDAGNWWVCWEALRMW